MAARLLQGERRALARALTQVERGGEGARELLAALYPHSGRAHLVGVTGPPGAGKSSLVNALARVFRARERSVAIVAVDPSSPFTGGALLGDRIRMQEHAGDQGVFIRSMASRGSLGGLARATGDVVTLLDAAGFDLVFVETVGAGQVEVDIARESHTTVVIEVPGAGDEVQAIKAGLLEIADIFAVNKADRDGTQQTVMALRMMLQLGKPVEGWTIPIVKTIATRGEGVEELAGSIESHRAFLEASGGWRARARARATEEFHRLLRRELMERFLAHVGQERFEATLDRLAAREIDPNSAAGELLDHVVEPVRQELTAKDAKSAKNL
ncbi:MAG TPA: methylmalonyl Co-A mutase-associated GTPase MeaB [Ardenticatenaceae bacterium]|nr:methylmalonyl Co-A mutase-associated GTPase MeaB [Ardenticatenaceae bacterium]